MVPYLAGLSKKERDGSTIDYSFELEKKMLHQLHGGPMGAHLREAKTLRKLWEHFYSPGHAEDVNKWCSTSDLCKQRKHPTPWNKATQVGVHSGYPMQMVATNILGPLPETLAGNSHVLVVADYFTHWVETISIANQEATTAAERLVKYSATIPPRSNFTQTRAISSSHSS